MDKAERWTRQGYRFTRTTGREDNGIYACDHCPFETLRNVFCETCGGRLCVSCVPCERNRWKNGVDEAVSRMREHLAKDEHGQSKPIKFDARDRLALKFILDEMERRNRSIAMLTSAARSPL